MKELISFVEFEKILNRRINSNNDDNYYNLLLNAINNPTRYCGIFRLSNAKSKLIQNYTQSLEIKFGDFMEELVTQYFHLCGYKNLEKNLGYDENGENLYVDQIFLKNNELYFVEQKVRDDHDSTKKRGQLMNFFKKYKHIKCLHPERTIHGAMWFVDPSHVKNKRYYLTELHSFMNENLHLFYGDELFKYLDIPHVWDELIRHLNKRKNNNSESVVQIPDFDTSQEIYEALLRLPDNKWNILVSEKDVYISLRKELFPTGLNIEKARKMRSKG